MRLFEGASRLLVSLLLWHVSGGRPKPSSTPQEIPTGGRVTVDFMKAARKSGRSFYLTRDNSTMFTYNAPLPPPEGVWGELVPFEPLDACSPLRLSEYTRRVGSKIQFTTAGQYPHVVALVARGNCTFEEKFDRVDDVPNVIGLIMFDFDNGDSLSNDIEISTFRATTVPGFLIDYKTGQSLLSQFIKMRSENDNDSSREMGNNGWIKVTLQYIPISGPMAKLLQYLLLLVMGLFAIGFAVSIFIHYKIYSAQRRLGEDQVSQARNSIKIDESFLEKLPLRKFYKTPSNQSTEKRATENPFFNANTIEKMKEKERAQAPVEQEARDEDFEIHALAPPNETCPICLDEFIHGETLNELPCGHYYHMSCIQPWLQYRSPECPLCKEDVRNAFIVFASQVGARDATLSLWSKMRAFFSKLLFCRRKTNEETQSIPSPVNIITPSSQEPNAQQPLPASESMHTIPITS